MKPISTMTCKNEIFWLDDYFRWRGSIDFEGIPLLVLYFYYQRQMEISLVMIMSM